jgi:predicted AAA+ superfamily ATPase
MALKPWYKVITPREDLRDGRPLDASEFAVHLDHVRDGRAPDDYKNPERFFDRTFLTSSLRELGSGVIRRLSGINVETSAIYNLTTQFGGGKTHALTLLYHLAKSGPATSEWKGSTVSPRPSGRAKRARCGHRRFRGNGIRLTNWTRRQ